MDIRLPQEFLQKLQLENPDLPKPLSRMSRRASLVSPEKVRGHGVGHPLPSVRLSSPRDLACPGQGLEWFTGRFLGSGATCWP